ncbi:hypothetical protein [Morganella psychrotolerans]|uniref:Lipoprotein n=1 Tax=Morganella psychrotolerans TaxID=368603 RepID=A0A1B8HRB7_9GAMM|nr:hypothetical protein [Morganella psychrotolerans]OBU11925.1 hypothetical protein AYY18_17770 [Morganella psychrotolerans]
MYKKRNIVFAVSGIMLLLLAGCDNEDTKPKDTASSVSASVQAGNWQVKPGKLSSANAEDIKADLALLNAIINKSNSENSRLLAEINKVKNDAEKVKEILLKNFENQSAIEGEIMRLTFKSGEVQDIRTQIISNIMLTKRMYDAVKKPDFDLTNSGDEFKQLSAQSFQMQQQIGMALDKLNQEYP